MVSKHHLIINNEKKKTGKDHKNHCETRITNKKNKEHLAHSERTNVSIFLTYHLRDQIM